MVASHSAETGIDILNPPCYISNHDRDRALIHRSPKLFQLRIFCLFTAQVADDTGKSIVMVLLHNTQVKINRDEATVLMLCLQPTTSTDYFGDACL